MKVLFRSLSEGGKFRERNDDSCFYDDKYRIMLIADGMGGYAGGDIASNIAVDIFNAHYMTVNPENFKQHFTDLFSIINDEIVHKASRSNWYHKMGTTLTVLCFDDNRYYIAHVGDCRCYRLRNGELECLTEDHNMTGFLFRQGKISKEEAQHHPGKRMLLRVLGRSPMSPIDFISGEIQVDDIFLLCTDGVSGVLNDDEIRSSLSRKKSGESILKSIIKKVKAAKGKDNITAVICKITE